MPSLRLLVELVRSTEAHDPFAFAMGEQIYLARLEGGTYRQTRLMWDQGLLALMGRVRLPDRDPADVARLGKVLADFLAPADWPALSQQILAAAEAGQPVELAFRLGAAELHALPFGLAPLGQAGRPLATAALLRTEWPGAPVHPLRPSNQLGRVLVAFSAAGGWVPSAAHTAAIQQACQAGLIPFEPQRDVLAGVSLAGLAQALADPSAPPVRVLHLLAHGAGNGQTYGIALDSDGDLGEPAIIDPARLQAVLSPHLGTLRLVVFAACDSANPGAVGNHLGSIGQAIHRAGAEAVLASRFPLSVEGANVLTEALYGALLVRTQSLEQAVGAAGARLRTLEQGLDWASLQLLSRPEAPPGGTRPISIRPYRGLLPFGPEHSRFFFGRDAERQEVADDLAALAEAGRPRFLVVAGASGTGKSSVVLSGALPDLSGAFAPAESHAPQVAQDLARTVSRLEQLLTGLDLPAARHGLSMVKDATAAVAAGGARMGWAVMRPGNDPAGELATALATRTDPAKPFLLVVDQFEEVFTHTLDVAERERFARRLWGLAGADTGVSVIVTLRVDFLDECGNIVLDEAGLRLDKVAYDEDHRVFVAQMGREQLRQAIEAPARKVGLRLEPGLSERMLEDVGNEPGALPLLSYTLDLLWARRSPSGVLGTDAYTALGGVTGALQQKADALIDALDEAAQHQARRLLVRLVGTSGKGTRDTRRRVQVASARPAGADGPVFDAVLAALVEHRLLVRSQEGGGATVEVAHEALIRKWARLSEWLDRDREMLAELDEVERFVGPWKQYGTLIEGDQLGYARQVAERFGTELSQDARSLLALSAQAIRDATRRRRLVRLVAWATTVVVTLTIAVLGLRALEAGDRARDRLLVSTALETHDLADARLALQEVRRPEELPAYYRAVRQHFLGDRPPQDVVHTGQGAVVAWTTTTDPKGVQVVVDGAVLLIPRDGEDITRTDLPLAEDEWVIGAGIQPGGGVVVAWTNQDRQFVVDPSQQIQPPPTEFWAGSTHSDEPPLVSDDGRWRITGGSFTVRVLDLQDPEAEAAEILAGEWESMGALALHENTLFTLGELGTLQQTTLGGETTLFAQPEIEELPDRQEGRVAMVASKDGELLAIAADRGDRTTLVIVGRGDTLPRWQLELEDSFQGLAWSHKALSLSAGGLTRTWANDDEAPAGVEDGPPLILSGIIDPYDRAGTLLQYLPDGRVLDSRPIAQPNKYGELMLFDQDTWSLCRPHRGVCTPTGIPMGHVSAPPVASKDGWRVYTQGHGPDASEIRVARLYKQPRHRIRLDGLPRAVRWAPDGAWVFVQNPFGEAMAYDPRKLRMPVPLGPGDRPIAAIAAHPEGDRLVAVPKHGKTWVFDWEEQDYSLLPEHGFSFDRQGGAAMFAADGALWLANRLGQRKRLDPGAEDWVDLESAFRSAESVVALPGVGLLWTEVEGPVFEHQKAALLAELHAAFAGTGLEQPEEWPADATQRYRSAVLPVGPDLVEHVPPDPREGATVPGPMAGVQPRFIPADVDAQDRPGPRWTDAWLGSPDWVASPELGAINAYDAAPLDGWAVALAQRGDQVELLTWRAGALQQTAMLPRPVEDRLALVPGRPIAITWTRIGDLSVWPLGDGGTPWHVAPSTLPALFGKGPFELRDATAQHALIRAGEAYWLVARTPDDGFEPLMLLDPPSAGWDELQLSASGTHLYERGGSEVWVSELPTKPLQTLLWEDFRCADEAQRKRVLGEATDQARGADWACRAWTDQPGDGPPTTLSPWILLRNNWPRGAEAAPGEAPPN